MVQRLLWTIGEGHRRGREEVVAEVPTEPEVAEMADITIPAAIAVAVGLEPVVSRHRRRASVYPPLSVGPRPPHPGG